MYRLTLFLALILPVVASADNLDTAGVPKGTYLLTIGDGGKVLSVSPIQVTRMVDLITGGPIVPPTTPPPGVPSSLEAEAEAQTKAAMAAGGSITTAAAFCESYFLVASGVTQEPPTIDHKRSLEAANFGAKFILINAPDSAKWTTFELFVRNKLQVLDGQGAFQTKSDYAGALKAVSAGITRATGYKPAGKALLDRDYSSPARRVAAGILDGINLEKLMEWIDFIIKLFQMFKPA